MTAPGSGSHPLTGHSNGRLLRKLASISLTCDVTQWGWPSGPAASTSIGRIPQASARIPARGTTTTITARLSDRSVVLVRACSSSG